VRVPFRVRIRRFGDAEWILLPEVHYQAASLRQIRATISLKWVDDADVTLSCGFGDGFVEVRRSCPPQTISPQFPAFECDDYFDDGAGDEWMTSNNLSSTRIRRFTATRNQATAHLDKSVFPQGRYEVEITRGAAVLTSDYSTTSYETEGEVRNLFQYRSESLEAPFSKDGMADMIYAQRIVSVWDESPIATDDFAVVAVRARNRRVESLSCMASGLVGDTGFISWTCGPGA